MAANKANRQYFPICPECGWHAEMVFGSWEMCRHQRENEIENWEKDE